MSVLMFQWLLASGLKAVGRSSGTSYPISPYQVSPTSKMSPSLVPSLVLLVFFKDDTPMESSGITLESSSLQSAELKIYIQIHSVNSSDWKRDKKENDFTYMLLWVYLGSWDVGDRQSPKAYMCFHRGIHSSVWKPRSTRPLLNTRAMQMMSYRSSSFNLP